MTKQEIILIGGGGHCKSVIDVIENENKFDIVGIVDVKEKIGESILGYKIIACDDDLENLAKKYNNFLITIGQIKSPSIRIRILKKLENLKVNLPVIISPFSHVSKHSVIGEGTVIMHNVIVNAGAKIGKNCIINSKALIEHDAKIGNNCHISTNAKINGDCIVKSNTFIGSGAILLNNITIEKYNIISAGAVVYRNTEEEKTYIGNPARKI